MHLDSNIVLQNIYSILGLLFWYGVIPFVIYQRVVSLYVSYFHYSRQTSKVKTMAVPLPFINDAIPLLPRFNNGENKQPITKWIEDALGGISFNKTTQVVDAYHFATRFLGDTQGKIVLLKGPF